jgi:hypothetical protein
MAKTQLMMTNRLLGALIRTIVFTGLFIGPTALPGDITREPIEENKA